MNEWLALATALNRTRVSYAPGWTDRNDADPGMTVLELMAYLGESPLVGRVTIERGSEAVARVLSALERVGTIEQETSVALAESWSGTKRPNYFFGKVLNVQDFTEEQNYLLQKHRLHLRTLHGSGIVQGLEVSSDGQGTSISIAPGLAIDSQGREVQLNDELTLTVPATTTSPTCIVLQYAERFVDPVPVPGPEDEMTKPSRVEEGCQVVLAEKPCDDGVVLARLINDQGVWRIDALFVPTRAR